MNGIINVDIADDKMKAYVKFIEPNADEMSNDIEINFENVIEILKRNRVTYGLREDNIKEAIEDELFDEYFLAAEGTDPVDGINASIEYKKNLESSMKPKLDYKGNVDYLNVDNYISVKAGEVLAVYIPAVRAVTGFNVFGKSVRATEGKSFKIPNGKNTEILEDGVTVVSKIDGLLQMLGGKISVLPVLSINSDVDTSTGNVDFVGSVKVYGNVFAGMKIKAKGSVEINGTVEGATIDAEGDIIINGGIKGMEKAIISSKGNIVTRYIENAFVKAKGNITTNSIVQSKTESGGKINVTGTNGSIIGGTARAAKSIVCKKLGSHNYIQTTAEVGFSAEINEDMKSLESQIQAIKTELAKINTLMDMGLKATTNAQVRALEDIKKRKPRLQNDLMNLEEKYDRQMDAIKSNKHAAITVIEFAYPGVHIKINDKKMQVISDYRQTTFFMHHGDISVKKCEFLDD
ncbi:MAG: DUF342 domain-containing protein [Oscillospiraceae bacterium]|nr:DUF342 domain-containing protein [Oscillospiraceae bacterium]